MAESDKRALNSVRGKRSKRKSIGFSHYTLTELAHTKLVAESTKVGCAAACRNPNKL